MIRKTCLFLPLLTALLFSAICQAEQAQVLDLVARQATTLAELSQQYLENPNDLDKVAEFNRLEPPFHIAPGQRIQIPARFLRGVPIHGTITFLKGTVFYQHLPAIDWRELRPLDLIPQNSALKTGPDGAVEITFASGDALFLGPNTELAIQKAEQKGASYFLHTLFLKIGKAISRLRKITGSDKHYEIFTPSAIAGARGTDFRVSVTEKQLTRCEVLGGKVGIRLEPEEQATVELQGGEGILARPGQPLGQPVKLLPPPLIQGLSAPVLTLPLSLTLSSDPKARSHRILVARDQGMRDRVQELVVKAGQCPVIASLDDGKYFLRASALDGDGIEGFPSPATKITVRNNPPPIIISPVDGFQFNGTIPAISWQNTPGAAASILQVACDKAFTELVENIRLVEASSHTLTDLPAGPFFIRARSESQDGQTGPWSSPIRFINKPLPAPPEMLVTSRDGERVTCSWVSSNRGINRYHVQAATTPDFSAVLVDEATPETTLSIQVPKGTESVFIRVSALADDMEGPFSPPQKIIPCKPFPKLLLGILGVLGLAALL